MPKMMERIERKAKCLAFGALPLNPIIGAVWSAWSKILQPLQRSQKQHGVLRDWETGS
jgi:hypothetical protein